MVVPSSEQKQSGKTHTAGSHGGARFGSFSISAEKKVKRIYIKINIVKILTCKKM